MKIGQFWKRLLCVICFFHACSKDDHIVGYVQTIDIDTNFVTDNTAVCSGIIILDVVGVDTKCAIIQTGILFSRDCAYVNDILKDINFTGDSACITSQAGEAVFNCRLEGLQAGTNYYVRAYAIIDCSYSRNIKTSYRVYGDVKTFTTKVNNFPAPKNLTANQVGHSIILDWNVAVDANLIWNYDIEKSSSEFGAYEKYGTSRSFSTTFTDTSPFEGMNFYRVKFLGAYSRESNYAYTSCYYISQNDNDDKLILPAPSGGSAFLTGDGIKVTWNKVQDASDYVIYRGNSENEDYSEPVGRVGNIDNWIDYNPLYGNNCYKVKAFNLYESDFSNCDCIFFP